jgi:parallel beta-helix repeat protein
MRIPLQSFRPESFHSKSDRRLQSVERRHPFDAPQVPRATRPLVDARFATIVVAFSDTSDAGKAGADFVCTGSGDQDVLQAAADALNEKGRLVLLEGTGYLDYGFYMFGEVWLEGMGAWATRLVGTTTEYVLVDISGVNHCGVRGLTLDGDEQMEHLLRTTGAGHGALVEDVVLRKSTDFAALLDTFSADYTTFSHNVLVDCGGGISNQQELSKVNDNLIRFCDKPLRMGGNAYASHAKGNIIQSHLNDSDYAILVEGQLQKIEGNTIEIADKDGILLDGANQCSVRSNTVHDASAGADNTYDGIKLVDSDDNTIQANTVRRNLTGTGPDSRYGINIDGASCNDNFVHGNDLRFAGQTANLRDAGTGTVKVHNRGDDI